MSDSSEGRSAVSLRPVVVCPVFEGLESRMLFAAGAAMAAPAFVKPAAALTVTPRPVTPVTPAMATAQTRRALGGNLQAQTEYSSDRAFVDLVKSSSGFRTLTGAGARVDSNGWPLSDFKIPVWEGTVIPGRYHVSFNGPSSVKISLDRTSSTRITRLSYNASTKSWLYAVDVPKGLTHLGFRFTGTAGQVKNLKVIQPGYNPAKFPVFTDRYVRFLKSLAPDTLRMMDFVDGNHNSSANWSDRPKATDATYTRDGVPWELTVQLANAVGSNLWVCVPVRATDDYVRQLATYIKANLRTDLKVYVEYSNEVWNQAFDQGKYNLTEALNEVRAAAKAKRYTSLNYDHRPIPTQTTFPNYDSNAITFVDRRTARRSKEIGDIFRSVFGASSHNTRVRVVLSGLSPQPGKFDTMLTYINKIYGAPSRFFYSLGVAPYFGLNKYRDTPDYFNNTFKTSYPHLTKDQVLEGMGLSISSYESGKFASLVNRGKPWGLKLTAYEGGVDTIGPFNVAAKRAATLDPRMTTLMKRYLETWYKQGGDLMNWFYVGAGTFNSNWGTWAITENLDDLNQPKEVAFRQLRGLK